MGGWGAPFVAVALLFFAFTSIVANYYYGETSIRYIRDDRTVLLSYRLLVLLVVLAGAVAEAPLIWDMADVAMGFMALINLVALVLLSRVAIRVMADCNAQLEQGVAVPRFDRSRHPEIPGRLAPGVW